jgi:tetratricopeptide (TPR) repeat protein
MRALCLAALAACAAPPREPSARELVREAAHRHASTGRAEEALPLLDRALAKEPALLEAYLLRGAILSRAGRPEEARHDFDELLRRDPAHLEARAARALLPGYDTEALADASAIIDAAPKAPGGYLLRGWLHRRAGRAAEAYRDFAEARQLAREAWGSYHNAAITALAGRRHDEAERLFVFAAELDPDRAEPHIGLGRVHVELSRFQDAVSDFGRAIERAPDAEHYFHRANALLALRRLEEAVADYDRALHLRPEPARYWYGRAIARLGLGQRAAAEADLAACVERDPAHREALLQRALLRQSLGRLDDAERDFLAALQVRATPDTILLLARLYAGREEWGKAVKVLEGALKFCTDPETKQAVESELAEARRRAGS